MVTKSVLLALRATAADPVDTYDTESARRRFLERRAGDVPYGEVAGVAIPQSGALSLEHLQSATDALRTARETVRYA